MGGPYDRRQQPNNPRPQEPDFWTDLLREDGPVPWPIHDNPPPPPPPLPLTDWPPPSTEAPAGWPESAIPENFDWNSWMQTNEEGLEIPTTLSNSSALAAAAVAADTQTQPSQEITADVLNSDYNLVLAAALNTSLAAVAPPDPPRGDAGWPSQSLHPILQPPAPYLPAELLAQTSAEPAEPVDAPAPTPPEIGLLEEEMKRSSVLEWESLIERTAQNLIIEATRNTLAAGPNEPPSSTSGLRRPTHLRLPDMPLPPPGLFSNFSFGRGAEGDLSVSSSAASDSWSIGSTMQPSPSSRGEQGLDCDSITLMLESMKGVGTNNIWALEPTAGGECSEMPGQEGGEAERSFPEGVAEVVGGGSVAGLAAVKEEGVGED